MDAGRKGEHEAGSRFESGDHLAAFRLMRHFVRRGYFLI